MIKMIHEHGRPADFEARLPKEQRVYELLDSLNIPYERVDHEPAMTMEACAEIEKLIGHCICKNLMLCNRQCTDFYLLLTPADKHFKTKQLSAQLGCSRLSFADGTYMEEFLDITPGSLSLLGLMNDKDHRVQLLVDQDIYKLPYFGCHPCINTSCIKLTTEDVVQKLIPALGHTPTTVTLVSE